VRAPNLDARLLELGKDPVFLKAPEGDVRWSRKGTVDCLSRRAGVDGSLGGNEVVGYKIDGRHVLGEE